MEIRALALLAIAIIAPCHSRPDEVDDFNKMSSSMPQKCEDNNVIVNDDNQLRTNLDNAPFISRLVQQGNNLFFKPQILVGTNLNNPFVSNRPADSTEQKEEPLVPDFSQKNDTNNRDTNIFLDVPEAPTLAPLEMPQLPETVIVEKPVVYPTFNVTTTAHHITLTTEDKTMLLPERPSFEIISPPTVKAEVIVPTPIPHIPNCMIHAINVHGITVPCPPAVVVPPEIINIENIEKNLRQTSTMYALNLPKIPLEASFNRPIKTLMPFAEDFISTTRFLPSFKGSRIPLEIFSHPKLVQYPNRLLPELFIEKVRNNKVTILEEKVPVSTASAYFAHNIALERIAPNIVAGNAVIDVAPLRPVLEIPVRPVF